MNYDIMKSTMIRRIIVKSNRRIALKMALYTSMFTGLFMAYFILMSFNGRADAEIGLLKAEHEIDSLKTQLAQQANMFWDSAAKSVPLIAPILAEDVKGSICEYGNRIHPIYKVRKFHHGRDFPAYIGTPVYATAYGVIKRARYSRYGYGNLLIVKHGFGYETRYAHLVGMDVELGDTVDRGDIIAYVGSTGLSTGPHLHYEVRLNGSSVDPKKYCLNDAVTLLGLIE